jgi:PhzF family phenazine biosynthesis protein
MRIAIKKVDAFTETPLTGNPAGVVPDASGLSDQQMQAIAREMAVPETAFILPASLPGATIRIRWFTPSTEVDLCGHATVAAFHGLAESGMHGMAAPGTYEFAAETRSGILPVTVRKERRGTEVFFGLPVPEFARAAQHKLDVMRLLRIQLEDFDGRLPIVSAGYLFVPVRRLHTIFALSPNLPAIAQFLENRKFGGLCVFTTEAIERTSSVHSRFFAPHIGIPEDPVTGSANGPLGVYLFDRGELESPGDAVTIVGEQGDAIGRKGRVRIHLGIAGSRVETLRISGHAVTVIDGTMIVG